MAIYKDRESVPVKETWDLQPLLGKRNLDQAIKNVLDQIPGLIEAYGKRLSSLENLVKYHDLDKQFDIAYKRVSAYLYLVGQQDALSPLVAKEAELKMKLQPLWNAVAAEEAEILANRKMIQGYLKDERLKDLRRHYELVFRKEPHVLPPAIAEHHAKVSPAFQNSYEAYSVLEHAETKFAPAKDGKGKSHEVSRQSISKLMRSSDRALRKNAQASFQAGEVAFKETLSRLLGAHWAAQHRLAQASNFADQVDANLFNDNSSKKLVESLYKAVRANLSPYKTFARARRTFLSKSLKIPFDKLKSYDAGVEFFGKLFTFSVEQAKELVLDSVAVLGKEYAAKVQKAFDSRWIDFHMTPNKRSGAFSYTSKSVEPQYILTNFQDDLDSVSALAHEVGHSMHSHHCHVNNPYELASYPIFTAEVASNFSELLLTEEILKNSKDDKVKFSAIERFIKNFNANVYYAAYTSEYEYRAALILAKDEPLNSWQALSGLYGKIYEDYITNRDWHEEKKDSALSNAVKMPHFYYNFYIYKYIIGMIGALSLMAQLKKDPEKGVANYFKFISSGTQQWPVDVLKSVGIDLHDQKTLNQAFALFGDYVGQYVRLGEKIFKTKVKP